MTDDLLDLHAVGEDGQVIPRSIDLDRARRMAMPHLGDDPGPDGDDVVPCEVKERTMVLDAGYVEQVFDEPLQPLAVMQDRLGGFVSHLWAQACAVMCKGRRESLDIRERGS